MLALADPSTGKTSEKMARQFLVTLVDAFERMPSKQEMEGKEAPDWRAKLRAIGIRPRRARAKAPMLRGSIERGRCGNREWFAQLPGG
jgi:hypothetical protein